MARHRNLARFGEAMLRFAGEIEENSTRIVRRAALIADTSVVNATPVDLGRARSSWTASIGTEPVQSDSGVNEDIGGARAASISLQQAQQVIGSWRSGQGSIFINNSVAYIVPLENGHSAQAPNGMVQQAVTAARNFLRTARLIQGIRRNG